MTNDLYNYHAFFSKIVYEVFKSCAEQNLFIVELRHIHNFVFDDDRKALDTMDELAIIEE